MIDGVGKSGPARIGLGLGKPGASAPAQAAGQAGSSAARPAAGGAVADIVAAGAPVDSDKVAAIRAAIQAGNYPVDPTRIAERMLELDLPLR
ncbi:flagellar biosynthesis anti-sigma factor FlgM [Sphingosinicella terrae]|uniref:flagellar biosynthesis anti-sigma factor FlgM n=1 Tax=Sphingosinicella terrae TaxID=2172047 RepID=UPI000E0CE01A|nr:flagellar biosynthesis anti-sigma factor FlgM [Sphingosinicella terrae]